MRCCTGAALTHAQYDLRARYTRLADVTEHARATASVVTFFATTEAATAISTVARTTTIAYVAIAVNASVKCSGMAIKELTNHP